MAGNRRFLTGLLVGSLVLIAPTTLAVIADPESELLAADREQGDFLGDDVAISGDTVIVGASGVDDRGGNAGAVYVFVRNGKHWHQQAKLLADDGSVGDGVGKQLALDGDTALVGVPFEDPAGTSSGACYVFTRTGGVWTQQAKLVPDDANEGAWFGSRVALEGDTALISAQSHDGQAANAGAVYVYVRSGGSWTRQALLQPEDGGAQNYFGRSVELAGETAMIGAWTPTSRGAVYVFTGAGADWTEQAKLLAADGKDEDGFGVDVSLDAGTALIGAAWTDDQALNSGAAYVFSRGADGWVEQTKLTGSEVTRDWTLFGFRVALDHDVAIIGASNDHTLGSQAGAAYLFSREGGSWVEQIKLTAWDGAGGDRFADKLDFEGTTAVFGAWLHDHPALATGSAFVFRVVDGEAVPASGRAGIVALVLSMLGLGLYLRRSR